MAQVGLEVALFIEVSVCFERQFNLRDATPGGNTADVVDCGALVPAETVAKRSLSRTRTQPDNTGNTELYEGYRMRNSSERSSNSHRSVRRV